MEIANWDSDQQALRDIRTSVFIIEQQIPPEEEWDALDARSVHVLARDAAGLPIGTARLTPERMIGRVAVVKDWRGRGVGDALMRTLIEHAQARHWSQLSLHAQVYAIAFYERAGFVVDGDEFMETGIPHRNMRRELAPRAPAVRAGDAQVSAAAPRKVEIETLQQAIKFVDELMAHARHKVSIYTRNLDGLLYDRECFLQALRRIALSGRGAEIRILLQDATDAVRDGHRLLHLAAKLPTYIHVRKVSAEEDRQYPSAFLLTDSGGLYIRPIGSRYDGDGHSAAPGMQAGLLYYFGQVWQRSEADPELRRLSV